MKAEKPSRDLIQLKKVRKLALDDLVLLRCAPPPGDRCAASIQHSESSDQQLGPEHEIPESAECLFVSTLRDYIQVILARRLYPEKPEADSGDTSEDRNKSPDAGTPSTLNRQGYEDGTLKIASGNQSIVREFLHRYGGGICPADYHFISRQHETNHRIRLIDDLAGYVYSKYDPIEMDIDNATEITVTGAKNLSNSLHDGDGELWLNGFKNLPHEALSSLIPIGKKYDGTLSLNSLESLNPKQAKILSSLSTLELNGLKTLDCRSASELVKNGIRSLHLNGIEQMDAQTMKSLLHRLERPQPPYGFSDCPILHLDGIKELDGSLARVISESKHSMELHLSGVSHLCEESAHFLTLPDMMVDVYLSGLRTIDAKAAVLLLENGAKISISKTVDPQEIINKSKWKHNHSGERTDPFSWEWSGELLNEIESILGIKSNSLGKGSSFDVFKRISEVLCHHGNCVFDMTDSSITDGPSWYVFRIQYFYFTLCDSWIAGPFGSLSSAIFEIDLCSEEDSRLDSIEESCNITVDETDPTFGDWFFPMIESFMGRGVFYRVNGSMYET